jgi:hypothetical protein
VQLKDILKEKTPPEVHQRSLVHARQCHGSPGTCNPEESGVPGPPVSLLPPPLYNGSGPIRLPTIPWAKNYLKGNHFLSDEEVIAAAETWLDGKISSFFLSGLQKLEQRAKKCIELRGEYVEYIPSYVAVAFSFLFGLRTYQHPLLTRFFYEW